MNKIEQLIEVYERRLATLKALRTLVTGDPALAAEVVSALTKEAPAQNKDTLWRVKKTTQLDKLTEYLKGGEWRTLPEMAAAVDAGRASIAPYLYRYPNLFESRKHPEHARMRQWHLKDQSKENKEANP